MNYTLQEMIEIAESKGACERSIEYLSQFSSLEEFVKNCDSKRLSEYAYWWAMLIGDREYMKQFVTASEYAYWWAIYIGDVEYMKQFITDSKHAYLWSRDIGDKEHMRQFVVGTEYEELFNQL